MFRMADGDDHWETLTNGLPENPTIRTIVVHPIKREIVYVGTQDGPYRSGDHGDHWEKVNVRDHGLPVWSILFHPKDPNLMYAGYENCEIYRSDDAGDNWRQLPIVVRFPEVTVGPGANLAKRVLNMSASASDPDVLYGALEVGGIIRTTDGGDHWENLSHGQYLNDDSVDMHGILVSNMYPGTVFSICRAGLFRSEDDGDHWARVPIEPLNEKGQTYCRQIRQVPGDPKALWVAAGGNFKSDVGALFHSDDGGVNWYRVNTSFQSKDTMFGLAFDEHEPSRMYVGSGGGEAWGSMDGGQNWTSCHLPEDVTQMYTMACG